MPAGQSRDMNTVNRVKNREENRQGKEQGQVRVKRTGRRTRKE